MYVLGIDAGGTKTQCAVADATGKILGMGYAGAANHQTVGIERTVDSLKKAIFEALEQAKIRMEDISYGVFGMAGADEADDFEILVPAVERLMGNIPCEVVHDSWIGFRAADKGKMGVVSICGTGAGHAGQNKQGQRLTLRNLDYRTGNLGGGSEIVEKALHYAFRSNEATWDKSKLEEVIPEIFEKNSLDEVCVILKHEEMTEMQQHKIPICVFQLAREGDKVCQKILSDMGYEEGRYAAAIIRRLGMEKEKVPMILIGSLFKTEEPYLINAYMKGAREAAPEAYPVILKEAPVLGAVGLALDHMRKEKEDL